MSRFVILSVARSGTNLLRLLLDQHPQIRCFGEVLSPDYQFEDFPPQRATPATFDEAALRRQREDNPIAFLDQRIWPAAATSGRRASVIGCKIFLPHLQEAWCAGVTAYLGALSDLKIVLLWRRDRLRRVTSMQQALTSGQWLETGRSPLPPPPVVVEPRMFQHYVASTEGMLDGFIAEQPHLPRFELDYETLVADRDASMERLFDFLGLPPVAVRPVSFAQGRSSQRAALLNYREMIENPPPLTLSARFPPPAREGRQDRPQEPAAAAGGAPTPRRWRLFCQVCADDLDILPHFLAHYRALGVTDLHLILHGSRGQRQTLRAAAAGQAVTIEGEYDTVFQEQDKCQRLTTAVQRYPGEWVLLADADEFLELPYASLERTVQALEVLRLRSLCAVMLQRLAADGTLPPLGPPGSDSPPRRYPLASLLLNERLAPERQPWLTKYPLFRVDPDTAIQAGHHLAPHPDASHAVPLQAVAHHFKWRQAFFASLGRRSELAHANAPEVRGYGAALQRLGRRLPLAGSFRPERRELLARGLLRRPDRRSLALYARLGELRRRRQREAERPVGDPRLAARLAPHWARLAAPLAGGPNKPAVDAGDLCGRRLHVALVTFQLPYSERSAGIGTAVAASAEALALAGHRVTILYAPLSGEDLFEGYRDLWQARGIAVLSFPFVQGLDSGKAVPARLTHRALLWLDGEGFDLVHFHDCLGLGAPAVTAKRGGALFARTRLVVTAHGPTPWHRDGNNLPYHANLPRTDFLERLQVAQADHLVSPSSFLLGWLAEDGYRLPRSHFAHPNLLSGTARLRQPDSSGERRPVEEIVFFGRIEPRKGLAHFLDAIDRLAASGARPRMITFLGRPDPESEAPHMLKRRQAWPFPSQVLDSFDSIAALRYVTDGPLLVVVPSLRDNLPYTVLECIANGVPLLSTPVGGIPEIVAAADHARILCAGAAEPLALALAAALEQGFAPARPAFDADGALLWWLAWHRRLGEEADAVPPFHAARSGLWAEEARRREVDLCVLPGNPAWNETCLNHVGQQVGLWLHVHVPAELARDSALVQPRRPQGSPLSVLRGITALPDGPRLTKGALGNRLAAQGDAAVIVFIDSTVELEPRALRVLADALAASGAAAAISGYEAFGHPRGTHHPLMRSLAELQPMGGPLAFGAYENLYGGPCLAIRRDRFAALGGFDEAAELGDFCFADLLNRLQLAGGEVLPLPLLLYRQLLQHRAPASLLPEGRARQRLLAPFLARLAPAKDPVGELASVAINLLGGIGWHRQPDLALIEAGFAGMLPHGELSERADLSHRLVALRGRKLRQLVPAGDARIAAHRHGIEVHSSGEDPILLLKRARLAPGPCQYLLRLEVENRQSAMMQLFWSTERKGVYSEEQSQRRLVPSGGRLAPARSDRMGSQVIRSLELYAVPL